MIDLQKLATSQSHFSQCGEERIVREFVLHAYSSYQRKISVCEFGAHDGANSNFLHLVLDGVVNGIFIECDTKRFGNLKKNYGHLENVVLIHDRVGVSLDTNLTSILQRHHILPSEVKVLSIDIDGDDIHILSSLSQDFDCVIIEYNPTFASDIEFSNPLGFNWGSSPKSLQSVAAEKNLFLAALTETNMVLINERFRNQFRTYQLWELIPNQQSIRFALGYDGTLIRMSALGQNLTAEVMSGGWGDALIVQPLPKSLRRFGKRSRLKMLYSCLCVLIIRPNTVLEILRRWRQLRKN